MLSIMGLAFVLLPVIWYAVKVEIIMTSGIAEIVQFMVGGANRLRQPFLLNSLNN